eukprot:COSAG06_NODE_10386_length_1689_cov_6.594969_3_plen_25_part_01
MTTEMTAVSPLANGRVSAPLPPGLA